MWVHMQVVAREESSAQYRGGGAGWDVEERDSVLGALGDGVVLWNGVKGLEVHQHLVRLVDAAMQTVRETRSCFQSVDITKTFQGKELEFQYRDNSNNNNPTTLIKENNQLLCIAFVIHISWV